MKQPFEQEKCGSCGRDGELVKRMGYRWRCRHCGQSWVTVGSPMDVANEIIWSNMSFVEKLDIFGSAQ